MTDETTHAPDRPERTDPAGVDDAGATLARARRGDRHALGELLARHRVRLEHVARSQMGPELRAKVRTSDILQSTFLEVVGSVGEFRGDSEESFARWVARILEHNIADAGKYFTADKRSSAQEESGDVADRPLPGLGPTPSSEAALTEELFLVGRALENLSEDHRRIILLRTTAGANHRSAAALLGRSEGATRVLLARARAALLVEVDRLRGADG